MLDINRIYQGDCLEVLKDIDDNSIDAIVTDPPYELGFMGKSWDSTGIANNVEVWKSCLRVLKPGGYLLSFGGTRTYHRMACAIEDAGFEIRDMIEWIYGSGFPKSLDISKAIDKMAGAERIISDIKYEFPDGLKRNSQNDKGTNQCNRNSGEPIDKNYIITLPSTPSAIQWQGWGTALKPAHEIICMARKPLSEKTVAENVLKYGTGGINIDECRVKFDSENEINLRPNAINHKFGNRNDESHLGKMRSDMGNNGADKRDLGFHNSQGRFPANLIHDGSDEVMAEFEKYGTHPRGNIKPETRNKSNGIWDTWGVGITKEANRGDSGTPARFFYCAKSSKSERDMGCEELEEKTTGHNTAMKCNLCGKWTCSGTDPCMCPRELRQEVWIKSKNNHPTVKPIKLMEYLIKLVTTENAIVLDPFAGSGSTLIACRNLGRNYIGIEKEADYMEIANKRIEDFTKQLVLV